MSNRRILGFVWLASAAVLFLILRRFCEWIWIDMMARASLIGGNQYITVPAVTALVLTVGIALWTWRHERVHSYSLDVIAELRKVVWPGRDELRDSTIVVIGAVFVFAGLLGGFDFIWSQVTQYVLYGVG